jgi:glucosamine-6-phosphate deaminase
MEVIIMNDRHCLSSAAARVVAHLVREKPNAVLGLATGSTPIPLYRELIRMHREEALDFSQVTTFNLDEYIGLPPEHAQSYHAFIWDKLLSHLNVDPENVHIPDGMAEDIPGFCERYEQEILEAGGIDLQILGIGSDGHIGFNEPCSSFASRTRIKTLTQQTVTDNARFFDGNEQHVPRHCITMGIGTIMDARMNLLLAFGESKSEAIAASVEGPVAAITPASILQHHRATKFFIDEAAASKLKLTRYYRWVYDRKPDWQQDT